MNAPVQPGNDPECRRAWDPRHLCIDAHGWPLGCTEKRCYYETEARARELGQKQRSPK